MMTFRPSILAISVAALAAATPAVSAGQQAPYSGIVVFGTSLSDSGNAFALRGGTNTPPDYDVSPLLVPDSPYARGGHHFSNGATWIEQFARSLGLAGTTRPAFASESPIATNYAVGAARACDAPGSDTFNLADQVDAYLADAGGVASPDALYVIEMGANDVRDAIGAALGLLQAGGTTPQQAIQATLPILACAQQAIQTAIQQLSAAGATQFLVWTAPDPGLTPAIRSLGLGAMGVATAITSLFNNQFLLPTLQALEQGLAIDIAILDAFALLQGINADKEAFGLTNTTAACITPSSAPYFCQQPDDYLFWDGIHPTRAAHAIVAQEAARVLAQQ